MRFDKKKLYAEAVSLGHPDSFCDYLAESLRNYLLTNYDNVKCGIEVCAFNDTIVLGGEVSGQGIDTQAMVDLTDTAKVFINNLNDSNFDLDKLNIINCINKQSVDIFNKVEKDAQDIGAGDQGIIYGYATSYLYDDNYYPLETYLAREITNRVYSLADQEYKDILGKDGKCIVELEPGICSCKVFLSWQHKPGKMEQAVEIIEQVINDVLNEYLSFEWTWTTQINQAGDFVIGGCIGDAGLTGRKLACDTYGGAIPNGGGALAGKDNTKVDRSAAIYSRYLAKRELEKWNSEYYKSYLEVLVGMDFYIGMTKPQTIQVSVYNMGSLVEQYELDDITVKDIYDYCQEYDRANENEVLPHRIK